MRILAVGAHPDDLEAGCGGTLALLRDLGHKIYLLVLTEGGMGGSPKTRRKEMKDSAGLLKAELFWGGLRDTSIPLTKSLINKIEKAIDKVKPDLTFTHYFADTHQDHRKVSQATTTASRYLRNVLYYEVPTTTDFNPSVFVDISKFITQKEKLLYCHKSQVYKTNVPNLSIIESIRSCAIFRGYQNRIKFAEGFVPLRLSLDIVKSGLL